MDKFLEGKKYINFDSLYSKDYLENQYKGKGEPFVIDGEEYFIRKITNNIRVYKELLAEEILRVLDIPHVSYQLAQLFGEPCLISKSFYKDDFNVIKGYELLEKYNKNYDSDYTNNIDMIRSAFLERYKLNEDNLIFQHFDDQLCTLFCFDLLFGNNDRKSDNWVIIEHFYTRYDGKVIYDEINLGPFFDNEMIFEDKGKDYAMGLSYKNMTSANNDFESIKMQIENNLKIKSKLFELKNKITEDVFVKCLNNIEIKMNFPISMDIKKEFLEQYHSRINQIEKIYLDCNLKR